MIALTFEIRAALLAAAMLAGLLVFGELGRWLGARRRARVREESGGSAVDASVFALFGLLVAFSFSGAHQRFDHRRALITEEASAIWTAYLRIDLVPAEPQRALRGLFRQYVESRLAFYREMTALDDGRAERARILALQEVIWKQAVEAASTTGNRAALSLVASGLNAMFDAEAERIATLRMHPPRTIFAMLFAVGFASAFLAGYSTAGSTRNWTRTAVFSASLALAVFVILNLEYPRFGLIRFGASDAPLAELLERMR